MTPQIEIVKFVFKYAPKQAVIKKEPTQTMDEFVRLNPGRTTGKSKEEVIKMMKYACTP